MTRRTRHQLRCHGCGLLFPSLTTAAMWCSEGCRKHEYRQRRKAVALVMQPTVIDDPSQLPASWQLALEPALPPFSFDGLQLRVITDEQGVPWFVAADVCAVLEIGNPSQALSRLDDDEKTLVANEGHGQREAPTMNAINESGLYSLILGSRKPSARAFKRWVTHEVLPAIRRTGSYALPGAVALSQPQQPPRAPQLPNLPPSAPPILIRAKDDWQARIIWLDAVWQALSSSKTTPFHRLDA